jgi:DNA-binding CsgD family transcriptional regulator
MELALTKTELVARELELAQLVAALGAANSGDGSLTVICGAAGVGKSSLVAAAAEHGRELGLTVCSGRGSELEQELSFGVVRQLFERPLRTASPSERKRLLSGAAAATARLFADAPLEQAAADDGGFATLHGLYWLTVAMATERPLLITVDDAHWADRPSLRALTYLAGRIADTPVALVVALRPLEPSPVADVVTDLEAQPGAARIELSELGPRASAAIVRDAFPHATKELCAAFHDSSAGNPFYLRELLRSFGGDGAPPAAEVVRQAGLSSVAERVMRRVASLGPHAPQLAAAMSVLGASGRLRDAAALAGLGEDDAAEAARAMRRVEILGAEDPFEWIHPLVRRSIYDDLSVTERHALHERAADLLEGAGAPPSEVAAHLAALRPAGSERVVAGLLAAAEEALTRDAPEVAASLLRRALDEDAATPPRSTLLLRLGQVEVARRNPAAIEILHEAKDLSCDQRERTLAAMALGEILVNSGQTDPAAEIVLAAIAELDGSDPQLALELEMTRAVAFAFDPKHAGRLWRERERLLALTRGEGWPAKALSALMAITSAMRGETLEEVAPLCERALDNRVLLSERGAGAWAPAHVLGALITIESYERAANAADEVEAAARSQGSVANALAAEGTRGWAAARCGDLARAEEILRPLVETAQTGGMLLYLITALWWMTETILERPSQDDLASFTDGLELEPPLSEAGVGGWPLLARGRVRAQRGAVEAAEEDLRAAGRIFDGLGFGPMHDPWRSSLALILPAERRDEAGALVAEELRQAEATGFARPRGVALRAAGLLAYGDAGIELLDESVSVLADSPARYEHARSLVELGAALRRSGRRGDSREPLEAGMELAHTCGAERLTARAREELLAAGARPRRIVRTGFAALTASERRVVRLAAEGRSNPEIAQALYVSVKTVETHLSNAYRTLGLAGPGSRRRLPQVVSAADRA